MLTHGIPPDGRISDDPGMVDHPARGQLNRESEYFPSRPASAHLLFSILRLNLVLRPTLIGTKNLNENGPNPLVCFWAKNMVRDNLLATVLFWHSFVN